MDDTITNGYKLAKAIIDSYAQYAIDIFFQLTKGDETKWLEIKSGLVGIPKKTQHKNNNTLFVVDCLFADLYKPAMSFANQDGGIILYGLLDPSEQNIVKAKEWTLADSTQTHESYRFQRKDKSIDSIVQALNELCKNTSRDHIKDYYKKEIDHLLKLIEFHKPVEYGKGRVLPVLVKKRNEQEKCLLLRAKVTKLLYERTESRQGNMGENIFNPEKCCKETYKYEKLKEDIFETHAYSRMTDKAGKDLHINDIVEFKPIPTDEEDYKNLWGKTKEIFKELMGVDAQPVIRAEWIEYDNVRFCAEKNNTDFKNIQIWLTGKLGRSGRGYWRFDQKYYIESIIPMLEKKFGRGCCPPTKNKI